MHACIILNSRGREWVEAENGLSDIRQTLCGSKHTSGTHGLLQVCMSDSPAGIVGTVDLLA